MLNRSRLFLSGHGDLFPTSKAAAHLTPRWILSRETPHAPGKGKCYASFTHPARHGKFQLVAPESHETKVVAIADAAAGLHSCTTLRPSAAAAKAAIAGVTASMSHKIIKTNDTPLAKANIAAKKASEELAMTRDFYAHTKTPPTKQGVALTTDYREAEHCIETRTLSCCKLLNDNKSGYTKEWFPHEMNPPAKPAPPPPKK